MWRKSPITKTRIKETHRLPLTRYHLSFVTTEGLTIRSNQSSAKLKKYEWNLVNSENDNEREREREKERWTRVSCCNKVRVSCCYHSSGSLVVFSSEPTIIRSQKCFWHFLVSRWTIVEDELETRYGNVVEDSKKWWMKTRWKEIRKRRSLRWEKMRWRKN